MNISHVHNLMASNASKFFFNNSRCLPILRMDLGYGFLTCVTALEQIRLIFEKI